MSAQAPPPKSSSAGATILPVITVRAPKARQRLAPDPKSKPKPTRPAAVAVPPAPVPLPAGVVLDGGPPPTQTTAGPVSGYRALTSVSATKTGTPIEQIPQAVAVVPRAVIDDQQPVTQADAFHNVSGVSAMPSNESLGYYYKVRGFPADRYVDGLPNYFDGGDFISLVNTERIEVLKGPAGLLYQGGFGPVGGIINAVSKLPTATPSAEAGLKAGGFGLWNPWFDVNGPLNAAGTVMFRMTGEFAGARDFTEVITHQRWSLNPTLRIDDHDGTVLTIQGRFSAQTMQNYSGLPGAGTVDRSLFTIRPDLFPGNPDLPKTTSTYDGLTVGLEHEISDIWSMSAATRISHMTLNEYGQFASSFNPALSPTPVFGSTFAYFDSHFPMDVRELSSNVNFVAKSVIGATQNTLLLGADYDGAALKTSFEEGFAGLVDLTNPVFPAYVLPTTRAFDNDNFQQNSGLTAQLQSTIGERLHLLAGVRLAHVQMHSKDAVAQTDFVSDAWKPVPRAGAVYDVARGVSVFADYSQSFRGVPFFNAGTAPKPEEAEQSEAGLKLALPSGFAATLAWFTSTRRNVVDILPGAPFTALQIGAQRSRGFDLDLTWQPLPGLSILASYAHIDAYVLQDQLYPAGNRLDEVPADSGRLWANYKFQSASLRNFSIGAGLYAASRQATALDNLYFTPAFVTFDAKIAYEKDHWSIALIGKNLADRRYFQPFPEGLGVVAPGEPLTVYLVATVKY
ncbi:MAG TPA: TonB-dependent siderophore receptor [Xanthobacteraceae bacterium]|nr:TonB-dependent siderophore receptor [Xanthobacteraceae bacterium]